MANSTNRKSGGRSRGSRGGGSYSSSRGSRGRSDRGRGGSSSGRGGRGRNRSRGGRNNHHNSSQQRSAESAVAPPPPPKPYVPPKAAAPIAVHPDRLKAMEERSAAAEQPSRQRDRYPRKRGNNGRNRRDRGWDRGGSRGGKSGRGRGQKYGESDQRQGNPEYYSGPPVPFRRPLPPPVVITTNKPSSKKRTLTDSVSTDGTVSDSSLDRRPPPKSTLSSSLSLKRPIYSMVAVVEESKQSDEQMIEQWFEDCIVEGTQRSRCRQCKTDVRRDVRCKIEHLRNVCDQLPSDSQTYFRLNYDRNGERVVNEEEEDPPASVRTQSSTSKSSKGRSKKKNGKIMR